MVAQPKFQTKTQVSAAEYLRLERASDTKHELLNGEIVAMAGGSERHSHISMNLAFAIYGKIFTRGCRAYQDNMRVKVSETGSYTYPDLVVVCNKPQVEDNRNDTLLNPLLLAEVLSPSTEAYDRGEKFQSYRTLDSLQEYLLVAQNSPRIEHYARQADGTWVLTTVNGLDKQLSLPALGIQIALSEVYINVDFTPIEE